MVTQSAFTFAGNAEPPIAALRYTLEDAVTTLKPNEQIILLMLSHSRCGAIGETLKAMCKGSSAELDDHPAGALVSVCAGTYFEVLQPTRAIIGVKDEYGREYRGPCKYMHYSGVYSYEC